MEFNTEINTGSYAQGLLQKVTDLGFDSWDIKSEDLEYIFSNRKFRIFHDFLQGYLEHDKVLTDSELICFKDIASIMLDKAKSDKLVSKMRKDDKAQSGEDVFNFDSF